MAVSRSANPSNTMRLILQKLNMMPGKGQRLFVFTNPGVPTNDDANHDPTKLGALCWDETNKEVYICTAYTNSTSHTWTKIS